MKKINEDFRILYALAIIFVVLGHIGSGILEFKIFPYYSLHIPIFVIGSGYFFKDTSIVKYLSHKSEKLLVPFFACNIFYLLVQTGLRSFGYSIGDTFSLYNAFIKPFDSYQPNGFNSPSWFVIAIFLTGFFALLIYKVCKLTGKYKEIVLFILCTALSVMAVMLERNNRFMYGYILVPLRSLFLLYYFGFGIIYRKYLEEWFDKVPKVIYLAVVVGLTYGIWKYVGGGYNTAFSIYRFDVDNRFIVMYGSSVLGFLFWIGISKIIAKIKYKGLLLYIGSHTFEIMTHHLFAIFIIQTIVMKLGLIPAFDVGQYMQSAYYFCTPNGTYQLILAALSVGLVLCYCFIKDLVLKGNRR